MIHYESASERGRLLCQRIAREIGDYGGEALVFVGALGICVRKFLPQLRDKHTDPAVVCVDSTGQHVIPVVGGHVGGANELARRIAHITGGQAVITTQSDTLGLWPLDTLAADHGWQMRHIGHKEMNEAMAVFVAGKPTALVLDYHDEDTATMERTCPGHVTVFHSYADFVRHYEENSGAFQLLLLVSPHLRPSLGVPTVQYCPPCLHLGVGCQKLASCDDGETRLGEGQNTRHVEYFTAMQSGESILLGLEAEGYAREAVASLCTIEMKRDEPLMHALRELLPGAMFRVFSAGELATVAVPNPSERVSRATGSPSVAEASALAGSGGGALLVEKRKGETDGFHYTFALATTQRSVGHVEFVGAGPGDPDLVSVRGRHFIECADLILYAGSLVPVALTECAKPGAVVRNSATMTLEEQWGLMRDYCERGKLVVRLHTGDPCLYGAIGEQMAYLDKQGISYHITPGISSFQAAAAELRSQFTIPGECQTVVLTRGEGRTPVPERERLRELARYRCTMCIFLSATLARQVQEELLAGGYPVDTPVAVCHKLTWRGEQQIFRGRLDGLADIVEGNNLTLTTMLVVGKAIDNRTGASRLYDKHFTHLYRQGE